MEVTISQVQALTVVARQQPPALPLSEQLQALAHEALMLADKDESALAQRLSQKDEPSGAGPGGVGGGAYAGGRGGPGPRNVTLDALQRLRVACMQLLCACEWRRGRWAVGRGPRDVDSSVGARVLGCCWRGAGRLHAD